LNDKEKTIFQAATKFDLLATARHAIEGRFPGNKPLEFNQIEHCHFDGVS
jgi:hypothetical protein